MTSFEQASTMDIGTFSPFMAGQRSDLLQKSLRNDTVQSYKIDTEFPIVLSPQKNEFSYCVSQESFNRTQLLAHANYWPRSLVSANMNRPSHRLALVGNVATRPDFRGKGLMRQVFDYLWTLVIRQEQDGLLLWSDLKEFYHSMGFEPCGQEWRMRFSAEKLKSLRVPAESFSTFGSDLSLANLQTLMLMRYPTKYTLDRSPEEFQSLLTIPETELLRWGKKGHLSCFCIAGKGADMQGVVHEFGSDDPISLLHALKTICHSKGWSEVMLLAPKGIETSWLSIFDQYLISRAIHNMAWVRERPNSGLRDRLEESFIWGLDSI